ncbi:SKA3 protein, partial [Chauna torquata]|nr:SKA3 protein [Chauna torquata]
MDVSRDFFGKLRALALTLEKEAKQLERALRGEDADYEDESPIRVLHDLHCEIRTLKEDVNASLGKSCSERQEIHDFMKASEILMQRNAADLGKIRELFQKYGYKPHVKDVNSDSKVFVQNKSDQEKANDVPHLPACTENPLVPRDPLRNPQLSDFGLSQYAFSRPWSVVNGQHVANAHQENSKNKTPLKTHTPCILPKTPKCMLKMDDYECLTPKLEHFGISEHTMCMNEDYTMALIHKTAKTSKNSLHVFSCSLCHARYWYETHLRYTPSLDHTMVAISLVQSFYKGEMPSIYLWYIYDIFLYLTYDLRLRMCYLNLLKKDDHEVNVANMTSREIMVTPGPKTKATDENAADCMASPMIPVFCTPGVKIPSRTDSTVLSKSPETDKLLLPSHTGTPPLPDFETRWLKIEAMVVNSNYILRYIFTISSFSNVNLGFFSYTTFPYQGGKIQSVTENDATEKQSIEVVPSAVSSDEYLKRLGDPSPPKIKQYDHLLSTPPPPEITRIPDDVLQILSKYNHKVDSSKAKKMDTKAGDTARFENDFTDYCNKENRYDQTLQIWL